MNIKTCITKTQPIWFFRCFGCFGCVGCVGCVGISKSTDETPSVENINIDIQDIQDIQTHIPERDTGFTRLSYLAQMASNDKPLDQAMSKRDRPSFDKYTALGCRVRPSIEATRQSLDWGVDRFYIIRDTNIP